MSVYEIDYNEEVRQHTAVKLRKTKRRAWLGVLVFGIKKIYAEFMKYRGSDTGLTDTDSILYKLAHNSQVCKLEAALNDVFDSIGRGIYITDGEYDDALSVYLAIELKPVYLATDGEGTFTTPYTAPAVLYTDDEAFNTGTDFKVHVPAAVAAASAYDEDRLKAIVKYYRLAGKRFTVVIEP